MPVDFLPTDESGGFPHLADTDSCFNADRRPRTKVRGGSYTSSAGVRVVSGPGFRQPGGTACDIGTAIVGRSKPFRWRHGLGGRPGTPTRGGHHHPARRGSHRAVKPGVCGPASPGGLGPAGPVPAAGGHRGGRQGKQCGGSPAPVGADTRGCHRATPAGGSRTWPLTGRASAVAKHPCHHQQRQHPAAGHRHATNGQQPRTVRGHTVHHPATSAASSSPGSTPRDTPASRSPASGDVIHTRRVRSTATRLPPQRESAVAGLQNAARPARATTRQRAERRDGHSSGPQPTCPARARSPVPTQ